MTSDLEQAEALAGLVAVLGVTGPLLWMVNNMESADPVAFMQVGVGVVQAVAVPAFGLIILFYFLIKAASEVQKI